MGEGWRGSLQEPRTGSRSTLSVAYSPRAAVPKITKACFGQVHVSTCEHRGSNLHGRSPLHFFFARLHWSQLFRTSCMVCSSLSREQGQIDGTGDWTQTRQPCVGPSWKKRRAALKFSAISPTDLKPSRQPEEVVWRTEPRTVQSLDLEPTFSCACSGPVLQATTRVALGLPCYALPTISEFAGLVPSNYVRNWLLGATERRDTSPRSDVPLVALFCQDFSPAGRENM